MGGGGATLAPGPGVVKDLRKAPGNDEEDSDGRSIQSGREDNAMARIKHIALTTQNPDKVAAFYKDALGLKEIRRSPSGAVFLTDGYINLAILNWKTEKDADVGANGPNYNGIHRFGFEVDDLDQACQKMEAAQATPLTRKRGLDVAMAPGAHRNFEMKWSGPDEVVIDISHTGWDT
jgi:catechol 2,3-dioxygenase-like lactoylglutathione lyase family enzyme